MLKAFKNQLSLLAIENGAIFAKKVKQRIGSKKANAHVSQALNLVMIMPDLIARINDLSEKKGVPSKFKSLNGFVLTYLYHPIDFLSDDSGGLFGYLDDAYLVGKVYQKVRESIHNPEQVAEDLVRELPQKLRLVREVIPQEAHQIDRLIGELEEGKRTLFNRLMQKGE